MRGAGTFTDDLTAAGMVWMAVVRSPFAHARIRSVDVSRARQAEGVVAAFAGSDLDWAGGLVCAWPVTEDTKIPDHLPLAKDKARYQGDGVAVVLAESRALAKDAAALVDVDYEDLPAVVDVAAAAREGAPLVHDDYGTNVSYVWKLETGEIDRLFAEAAVTVKERYRQQRLIPNAIEPRSVLAQPGPGGEITLWSATQIPHVLRTTLALTTGIPEAKLRIIAPDVGGAFGSKLDEYAEEALAVALAQKLGRPVKWTEERSEGFLATIHGRDVIQEIELAATAEGQVTAVRANLLSAMGAYMQLVTPGIQILGAWLYGGAYDLQAYSFTCTGVFTNTTPTDAYRGAGRPEATYAIEHAMDALARKLDMDPAELRRLNFIKEFPKTIASGLEIDSGDFDGALDRALELLDYDGLRREQHERNERGDAVRLGIGLSTYTEMCGLAPSRILGAVRYVAGGWDAATVRMMPDRHGAGRDRHLAARPGTRDDVLADRGRAPRHSHRECRGPPRRHGNCAARHGHVRQPVGRRRRCRGVARDREGDPEGTSHRRASARGRRRGHRVRERNVHRSGHGQDDERRRRRLRGLDGAQPSRGHGADHRGDRSLRPSELQLAGRLPCRSRRGRHGYR